MNGGLAERARVLLYELRRPADAEDAARDALAADPDNAYLHCLLAEALRRQGKLDAAAAAARTAVGLAPDYPAAHSTLGLIAYQQDAYYAALDHFHEALRNDPGNADLHDYTAMTLLAIGRSRQARAAAEGGLYLNPEHVGCLNRRALALAMLGRTAAARAALEQARSIDPDDAQTHCNLGWLAASWYGPWTAARHYRDALRLDPTTSSAVTGQRAQMVAAVRSVVGPGLLAGIFGAFVLAWVLATALPLSTAYVGPLVVVYSGILLLGLVVFGRSGEALLLYCVRSARKLMTRRDRSDLVIMAGLFFLATVIGVVNLWFGKVGSAVTVPVVVVFLGDLGLRVWHDVADAWSAKESP